MASKATMGCISMKSIRSSIISLVHVPIFSCILEFPLFPPSLHTCVVVIMYIHKLMLIRILSSDWSISIQFHPSWKKNRMHFYSIQVRSSFLIQVSCMVYTIKKLEFKKLEWRLGCKTCIVYTGLNASCQKQLYTEMIVLGCILYWEHEHKYASRRAM
jgi:hypothetical protein